MKSLRSLALAAAVAVAGFAAPATAQDSPELIFRKSTVFKLLTPNDKLATYAIDDPIVHVAGSFMLLDGGAA